MFYEIRVPRTSERNPIAAASLIQSIVDSYGDPEFANVLFLICSDPDYVMAKYLVMLPKQSRVKGSMKREHLYDIPVSEFEALVRRFYPDAIVEDGYPPLPDYPIHQRRIRYLLPRKPFDFYNPILTFEQMRREDPFASMAQYIANTPKGDLAYMGVHVVSPRITDSVMGTGNSFLTKAVVGALTHNDPMKQHQLHKQIDNLRDAQLYKAAEGAYVAIPYVCYSSPDANRLTTAESMAQLIFHCGIGKFQFTDGLITTNLKLHSNDEFLDQPLWTNWGDNRRNKGTRYKLEDDNYFLTAREIASLWHLPESTYPTDVINWYEEPICREIPDELKTISDGQLIGTNVGCDANQTRYPVRLPRGRDIWHTLILGKTGMGETTLMRQMIHEDIVAGRTVIVIDPKGSQPDGLVNRILEQSIPDKRIDDVVLVDLTAIEDYPPAINPLMGVRGKNVRFANASRNRVTADFVSTLIRLYGDTDFRGTRMEDWLRLALKTIAVDENATLSDVRRVLRNSTYRNRLIEQSEQLPLLEDWEEFDKADRAEGTINGVLTRIRRFMQSNETLSIVCHPRPIHYGELVAQGKIILVSAGGQPSTLSEEERLTLASVIVTQIMDGAMSALYSQPVSMYIDEAGKFVNAPIPDMLRLVRSGNLSLTLASQGMSALSTDMQHAIDETVATIIGFAMSETDAKMVKPYITDVYTPDELQTLPQFTAATATRYNGKYLRAFQLEVERPTGSTEGASHAQAVRRRTIEKYMPMSYGEVLEAYKQRYATNSRPNDNEPSDDDFIKRPSKA